jgi:long-chain-fatty-acid--[acyl-carrier-protein] ligase
MKKRSPLIILFLKFVAFVLRLFLRSRYSVSVVGVERIPKDSPVLYLPNHPALVDPLILFSEIYRFSTATPVITEKYYDIPVVKGFLRLMGAVRVSDLEAGSRDTMVLKSITRSVFKGFRRKNNVVVYPAGQLAGQGHERIFNKKSAYYIVKDIPPDVRVAGVRISGLWGSMWSKARTGRPPDFFSGLFKGFLYLLANLLFFVPRRAVVIEFEDITESARMMAAVNQKTFNTFLEDFYNKKGDEPALFRKYFFFIPRKND